MKNDRSSATESSGPHFPEFMEPELFGTEAQSYVCLEFSSVLVITYHNCQVNIVSMDIVFSCLYVYVFKLMSPRCEKNSVLVTLTSSRLCYLDFFISFPLSRKGFVRCHERGLSVSRMLFGGMPRV